MKAEPEAKQVKLGCHQSLPSMFILTAEDLACYARADIDVSMEQRSDRRHGRLAGQTIPILLTWTVTTRAAS